MTTIVPFRSDDPDRLAAFRWLTARLEDPVIGSVEGDWCKARAISSVVDGDLLVIHDADVWCDGTEAAVEAVRNGAAWAVPHEAVRRMTRSATAEVLAGGPLTSSLSLDQGAYVGRIGGGIVVLRRDVWDECPMDPRFVGWGQEDDSWAIALSAIFGPPWRGYAPLWHLWHTPQPRMNRLIGSEAGRQLWERYKEQRHDADGIRALLDEFKVSA